MASSAPVAAKDVDSDSQGINILFLENSGDAAKLEAANEDKKNKKSDLENAKVAWKWQNYLDEILKSGRNAKAKAKLTSFQDAVGSIMSRAQAENDIAKQEFISTFIDLARKEELLLSNISSSASGAAVLNNSTSTLSLNNAV